MRLLVARCTFDYNVRLTAYLPEAIRLLMVKADGCVAIHADGGAYKPLNWMVAPNTVTEEPGEDGDAATWIVTNPKDETLTIRLHEILSDESYEFGEDPGLSKDGVEAHLQKLLADNPEVLGEGYKLVRREFPTDIGPVDLLLRDADGNAIAVEIKRRGEIDGVEQLTRYLDRMKRDPMLNGLRGIFAAQIIKPQAKVLAASRDIECIEVDYDELRGIDSGELRLF